MTQRLSSIESEKAPQAAGPYSHAIRADMTNSQLLFISGQLPINPKTGKLITGGIRESTCQILDTIQALLEASQSDFSQVVRVEIFLTDLNDFQVVNEEYKKRFTNGTYPARQTIQVARLPLDACVEISCIALCPISI